jgi:hypothetical protein
MYTFCISIRSPFFLIRTSLKHVPFTFYVLGAKFFTQMRKIIIFLSLSYSLVFEENFAKFQKEILLSLFNSDFSLVANFFLNIFFKLFRQVVGTCPISVLNPSWDVQ